MRNNEELGNVHSLHNFKFDFTKNVLTNGLKVYIGLSKELEIL